MPCRCDGYECDGYETRALTIEDHLREIERIKNEPRLRQEKEDRKKADKKIKEQALQKLTAEERRVLGL